MTEAQIPRLVVVLDRAGCREEIGEVAAAALRGGADIVQIREKDAGESEVEALSRQVIAAVGGPARIAINGRPALAAGLGTHLHLPECHEIPADGLELGRGKLLSRSIHGPAPDLRADYAVLGNVLETGSKPGKPGLGFETFGEYARTVPRPVLAIGGIKPGDVAPVLAAGAYGIAVRSYVIGSPDPERAAREFRMELDKWAN